MMKNTPEDEAVSDKVHNDARAELRAFVERFERVQVDIDALKEDQREIMAELKGRGYQAKPFREVIKLRKLEPDAAICIVGDEPEPPYSRMAIPYLLMDRIDERGTHLRARAGHFEDLGIEVRRARVSALDPIALDPGERFGSEEGGPLGALDQDEVGDGCQRHATPGGAVPSQSLLVIEGQENPAEVLHRGADAERHPHREENAQNDGQRLGGVDVLEHGLETGSGPVQLQEGDRHGRTQQFEDDGDGGGGGQAACGAGAVYP